MASVDAIFDRAVNEKSNPILVDRRLNNMAKSTPSFEFTIGDIQEIVFLI